MNDQRIRLGVAGLGRAFTLMLPTLVGDRRVRLAAAADPRPGARAMFEKDFGARTHESVEALCGDSGIDAVYVATPHELHARHACLAAASGKHVLVEKPMALSLDECRAMIDAADKAGVTLTVGHSHSFDRPVLRAREIIRSGEFGRVNLITSLNYTDFMYRFRRPEELVTDRGGGVVFSQAAHQIDVVRLLGGGRLRSIRAVTGAWDRARPSEGAYTALLTFEDGAAASIVYSGYGHFDSDELMEWIGESGQAKDRAAHGAARRALSQAAGAGQEAEFKAARNYGGSGYKSMSANAAPAWHQHFGFVVASCDRADLRPTPSGVMIYGDLEKRFEELPRPAVPRAEVIDELHAAIFGGKAPLHGGAWAMATMEACLALLQSAREQREIRLAHQVGAAP